MAEGRGRLAAALRDTMNRYIRLVLKNCLRNRRRNMLTIASIAVSLSLAEALRAKGLRVWYEFRIEDGDSLRRSIDRGLAHSRFGVVILSGYFFQKHWPQQELNGLVTREDAGKVILPVWHGVGFAEVRNYSPMLADRKAAHSKDGLTRVVDMIVEVVAN